MSEQTIDLKKRRFLTNATSVVGAVGVGFVAWPVLLNWKTSSTVLSRLKIQTGFLRQSTRTNCPSSSLLISTSIGAPAAFALADGFHVDKNKWVKSGFLMIVPIYAKVS
jgi:uncharacterized membrane protein YebE (DUF533 family)